MQLNGYMWVRVAFHVLGVALAVGIHLYLYRRLVKNLFPTRVGRWALTGGLGSVSGFAILLRPISQLTELEVPRTVVLGASIWLGVILNLLMVTVSVDLIRKLASKFKRKPEPAPSISLERREFLTQGLAAGTVVLAGGLAGYGTWRAFHRPDISTVPIRLRGLNAALDGFKLVQISDIHIGHLIQRKFMDELVAQVNSLKPDLLAITGDLVDGPVSLLGPYVHALTNVKARFGSYFILGNHEYYAGANRWVEALQNMGIPTLRNHHVRIGDSASFDLIGVDDWDSRRFGYGYDLNQATAGRDPSRASVLLAHQPRDFETVAAQGLGLQLSGHTHGGQMFPGNLVGQMIWGERNTGLSRIDSSYLYTSRGCGFVGPPMRVGAPPEIVEVVLMPG